MGYKGVIKKIELLDDSDFTVDCLKDIGKIYKEINYIYGKELINQRIDAKVRYYDVKEQLNYVIFYKLKEKLGFEDEVINQIICFMDFIPDIQDIYVLDGNVIIKAKVLIHNKPKVVSYFLSNNFYDVSSKKFVESLNYNVYIELFVNALNNAMVPYLKDKFDKSQLLNTSNKQIGYNLDNLNIYINKSLKEMMQNNTDVTHEVAKVLIKYNDELYYFDLKIHYAYLELVQNDYPVKRITEMLSEKEKVKKI